MRTESGAHADSTITRTQGDSGLGNLGRTPRALNALYSYAALAGAFAVACPGKGCRKLPLTKRSPWLSRSSPKTGQLSAEQMVPIGTASLAGSAKAAWYSTAAALTASIPPIRTKTPPLLQTCLKCWPCTAHTRRAVCFTFGRQISDMRQGVAIFVAMTHLLTVAIWFDCLGRTKHPTTAGPERTGSFCLPQQPAGSARRQYGRQRKRTLRHNKQRHLGRCRASVSNGSVNALHDSFTPLGGACSHGAQPSLGEVVLAALAAACTACWPLC